MRRALRDVAGSRRTWVAAGLVAVCALMASPARAAGLDCRPDDVRTSRAKADLVVDAVALSGPAVAGRLVSPARMQVLRYRKGRGPRILAVGTGLRDALTGLVTGVEGEFIPSPGEVWRIYGRLRGARSRVEAGEVVPTSVCYGSRRLRKRVLKRIPRSEVGSRESGGTSAWRAFALRGPSGLRCARYRRLDRGPGRQRHACERVTHPRSAMIEVLTDGAPHHGSTVILALAPRLRALEVTGPDGSLVVRAVGRGRIAMAVLGGYVAPSDLRLSLRFAGGATRTWRADADLRVQAPDPLGGPGWTARTAVRGDRLCAGFQEDPPRFGGAPVFAGRVTCRSRDLRLFYAVGVPLPVAPGADEPRTALYGAADGSVRSVAVVGPDGRRDLALARRGRAFLTVYAGIVSHSELTVEVTFTDGSTAVIRGARSRSIGR